MIAIRPVLQLTMVDMIEAPASPRFSTWCPVCEAVELQRYGGDHAGGSQRWEVVQSQMLYPCDSDTRARAIAQDGPRH